MRAAADTALVLSGSRDSPTYGLTDHTGDLAASHRAQLQLLQHEYLGKPLCLYTYHAVQVMLQHSIMSSLQRRTCMQEL